MDPDAIMQAVTTSGVYFKNKQIYFHLKETERRYARHVTRVILMLLRVRARHRSSNNAIEHSSVSEGMNDALTAFVHRIPKNLNAEDGEAYLDQEANMPQVLASS